MTPISIDAPLSSLLDALVTAGAVDGVRSLARLRGTTETRLQAARRAGPRIKLATLAAYARAAGWCVLVEGLFRGDPPGSLATCGGTADDLDVTVAGAQALLAALGLEMTLAVEPAETKR